MRFFIKFFPRFVISLIYLSLVICHSSFASDSFSFVSFGDNQGRFEVYKLILDKVSTDPAVAFGIHCGDFTGYGTKDDYVKYRSFIGRYPNFKIYHAQGNHDAVAGGWKRFEKYIGPFYYSFDYKNVHFIVLNNAYKESISDWQIGWLKSDLAKNKKPYKVVAFHKPVFDPAGFYTDHIMDSKKYAVELQRIFEKYKVDYVICGHIHGCSKKVVNGVTYVISAGAGAALYLPPELGGYYNYARFDVDQSGIQSSFLSVYE